MKKVRAAWGITIRDGYDRGPTRRRRWATPRKTGRGARVDGAPAARLSRRPPQPGHRTARRGGRGICSPRPVGAPARPLMTGYRSSEERQGEVMRDGYYHTRRRRAQRSADGTITYESVGARRRLQGVRLPAVSAPRAGERPHRAPRSSRGRGGPVTEDQVRLAVPKAFVVLAAGQTVGRAKAESILRRLPGPPGAVQAGAPVGVRRPAQDDQRQDPAGCELRKADASAYAGADQRPPGEGRDGAFPRGCAAPDAKAGGEGEGEWFQ